MHIKVRIYPITKRIIGRRHGAQAQGCTKCTAQAEHRIDEPKIFLCWVYVPNDEGEEDSA